MTDSAPITEATARIDDYGALVSIYVGDVLTERFYVHHDDANWRKTVPVGVPVRTYYWEGLTMTDSAPSSINPRTYCNRCDADYVPGDLVVGPYPLGDYRHATCPDDGNVCTNDRLPRFTYWGRLTMTESHAVAILNASQTIADRSEEYEEAVAAVASARTAAELATARRRRDDAADLLAVARRTFRNLTAV
jgi:hypothetical protein